MKKTGILNSEISKILADMGHTDQIVVGDCGLPISKDVKKIDLAIKLGTPSFIEVVEEISKNMEIEKIIVASEMIEKNKAVFNQLKVIFKNIEFQEVNHEQLKKLSNNTKAFVRTGESTPYANCILQSGVIF